MKLFKVEINLATEDDETDETIAQRILDWLENVPAYDGWEASCVHVEEVRND